MNADLQQDDGVQEAEQVQQDADDEQDGPVSQTGAVEQEQMTRHQAAHQTRQAVQQLQSHYHLHRTHIASFTASHNKKTQMWGLMKVFLYLSVNIFKF